MHLLTVDYGRTGTTVSEHPDAPAAYRALARCVDHADSELRPIHIHPEFSSWDVVAIDDNNLTRATATVEITDLAPCPTPEFSPTPAVPGAAITADTTAAPFAAANLRTEVQPARAARPLHRAS